MRPTIQLLSEETINQIAAGEVIESPASVVKELVENAFDAGAESITVEIIGGGLKLIRVSDDGKGMNAIDAELSIKRHATSKIVKAQDLFRLKTMGFRGEALASIAAISKMVMSTAEENQVGTKLEIEKGEIVKKISHARARGTTIEVHSLFYNVPARKKFQKMPAAIAVEIFRMVTIMALSHPSIGFTLISNRKKTFEVSKGRSETPLEQMKLRMGEILGEGFAKQGFLVNFTEGPLRFLGMIGAPTMTRANRMSQYLFLNHRSIQCEPIEEAVRQGYATRLEEKRYPVFFLHLHMPSDLVDVNVHPQKTQVRLRDEVLLREKVQQAIETALAPHREIPLKTFSPTVFSEKIGGSITAILPEEIPLRFQERPETPEFPFSFEKYKYMGIIGPYLFLEGDSVQDDYDGVVFVNLEAARARILFEQLQSQKTGQLEQQTLLIPFSITFTPIEFTMILSHQTAIEQMGFRLKPVAQDTFMVEAIPSFVKENDVQKMIEEMAVSLQNFIGKIDFERERQKRFALIASYYAKKEENLSKDEALKIFKKLNETKSPLFCPKGSVTMIHVSRDEIQSLFRTHQKTAGASS